MPHSSRRLRAMLLWSMLLSGVTLPVLARRPDCAETRTVKIKIALDEEFRHRTPRFAEVRKWIATASYFFERNFGLAFEIAEIKNWNSDNTQRGMSGLFQDLYAKMDRGKSDIVLGITGQFRGETEVSGVASYRHGCALVKRMRYGYLTGLTVIHELAHLFGAVDLAEKSSIMNKDEPRLECDEFTRKIIHLNKNRRFDPAAFPLSPEEMNSAIALYLERKQINRGEAGLPLMLAIFYLELKDYEKAVQECLEAEKLEPRDAAIQRLLELANSENRKKGGTKNRTAD